MDKEPQFEFSPRRAKGTEVPLRRSPSPSPSWNRELACSHRRHSTARGPCSQVVIRDSSGRPQSTWMTRPCGLAQTNDTTGQMDKLRTSLLVSHRESPSPLFRHLAPREEYSNLTACKRKVQCREGAKNRSYQWEGRLPSALTWSSGGPVNVFVVGVQGLGERQVDVV